MLQFTLYDILFLIFLSWLGHVFDFLSLMHMILKNVFLQRTYIVKEHILLNNKNL